MPRHDARHDATPRCHELTSRCLPTCHEWQEKLVKEAKERLEEDDYEDEGAFDKTVDEAFVAAKEGTVTEMKASREQLVARNAAVKEELEARCQTLIVEEVAAVTKLVTDRPYLLEVAAKIALSGVHIVPTEASSVLRGESSSTSVESPAALTSAKKQKMAELTVASLKEYVEEVKDTDVDSEARGWPGGMGTKAVHNTVKMMAPGPHVERAVLPYRPYWIEVLTAEQRVSWFDDMPLISLIGHISTSESMHKNKAYKINVPSRSKTASKPAKAKM